MSMMKRVLNTFKFRTEIDHVKKHIRKSLISGSTTTDPYRILSEQKRFYQNLYKTNDSAEASDSIEAYLNSLNIPKLSKEQRQSCEGRITTEECRTIIETFQNNKSRGNDGIPIDLISEPFIDCANENRRAFCFFNSES